MKRALIETPRVYLDRVSKPIVYGIAALGLTLAIGIGVISYSAGGGGGGGGGGGRLWRKSRRPLPAISPGFRLSTVTLG